MWSQLGMPSLGALLCRGPDSDRLCGLWVKESTTNDNCYYCTICLHLVIYCQTVTVKKVSTHLSDAKTKAERGRT